MSHSYSSIILQFIADWFVILPLVSNSLFLKVNIFLDILFSVTFLKSIAYFNISLVDKLSVFKFLGIK